MRDVVMYCVKNGASFSGELLVSEFAGARAVTFEHTYSEPAIVRRLPENEIAFQLDNENVHVAKVGL
jgi:hypothetical protein